MLPTSVALTIFAVGACTTLILGIWTWRRLRRHPVTDRYSTVVYRHGVRHSGGLMFVAMTFVMPLFEADSPLGPSVASPRFWGDFVLRAMNRPVSRFVLLRTSTSLLTNRPAQSSSRKQS